MERFLSVAWAVLVVVLAVGMGRGADGAGGAGTGTKIKVACVGDSITAGSGVKGKENFYPAQLGKLLGDGYEVKNFGLSGATLLSTGDKPYAKSAECRAALALKPDVVVIMLGTNDSKAQNWGKHGTFVADYKALVKSFKQVNEKMEVYVCMPPPAFPPGAYGIRGDVIEKEVTPLVLESGTAVGADVIDLRGALGGHKEMFPDGVHPNAAGAGVLARVVYKALTGQEAEEAASQPAGK